MNRRRRQFHRVVGGSVLAGLAAPWAGAARREPLVVWFTVEGAKAMRAQAVAFTAATGVEVIVETPDDGPAKYQQASAGGKGPDIYVYAHDRIGEWISSGLIQAVTPSQRRTVLVGMYSNVMRSCEIRRVLSGQMGVCPVKLAKCVS